MTNPFALDTPAQPPAAPAAPAPAASPAPSTTPPADQYGDADPFDNPAPQAPRGPRIRDMYGRLLLIIPHKLEEGIASRFRDSNGNIQTQDRMTADVIILDGGPCAYGGKPEKMPPIPHDKTVSIPYAGKRMYVSNAGLISQCRQALAKKVTTGQPGMVLGRLTAGEAKGDNNAPFLLDLPTDADKAIARAYLQTVDPFS